jgi:hypothetical protein
MSENMSPGLLKVVERAGGEPQARFHSLAHLIDVPALERSYQRQRKNAAAGVDGVKKEQYGEALLANLCDLHERMKTMRYRHRPLKGVYIPKGLKQSLAQTANHRSHLGIRDMSHHNGGAGWWQSPSPDLERASDD